MTKQLDLFERKSAHLIIFPAARMVGAHRIAAHDVLSMPVERQAWRIRHEVGLLRLRLMALNQPMLVIERQAEAFRAAIEYQIGRLLEQDLGEQA